jgi:hypothetical protein
MRHLVTASDDTSIVTHNSEQNKDVLLECKSTNHGNDDSEATEVCHLSVVNDSKETSSEDMVADGAGKSGSELDAIQIEGNDSSESTVLEVVISDKSLEVSRAGAMKTLAAIIVTAQERAGADQETTSHQELERLIVAVAAKEEELVDRDEKIAALEQKLSDTIKQSGHEEAVEIKRLNETIHELASMQAKLMEQLSATTMVHATAERVERDVAKCKIKNFVKKLEDRVKMLEASEEEAKQLKISVAKLQEKNMQVIVEKEALTKHLVLVEEEMTKIRNMKAELDAAKEDYHHAKHRSHELEAVLNDMELSNAQLETEARNHQEHRSILSSKVRNLKEEIALLTDKLKNMEAEQSKAPIFAEKKCKKRKTAKKELVCPQETVDLDMYLLTVKSNHCRRRSKFAKAAAVAILAALSGLIFACGTFPADSGMSEGSRFCKPTHDTVAWLAGTSTLSAELQLMRKKSQEIKTRNAKLEDLVRDKEAEINKLIENHRVDRQATMEQIMQFKRMIASV